MTWHIFIHNFLKRQETCERFIASLAQLSTSLWRSSVKVPFLWWGAEMLVGRHCEPPWLWLKTPEPLTALVLLVPVGGERGGRCKCLIQWEDETDLIWMNGSTRPVCALKRAIMVTEAGRDGRSEVTTGQHVTVVTTKCLFVLREMMIMKMIFRKQVIINKLWYFSGIWTNACQNLGHIYEILLL